MNGAQGPLYWLLISDQDKPAGRKLFLEPTVWLYWAGIAIWGFACHLAMPWDFFWHDTDSLLTQAIRMVAMCSLLVTPTVVLFVRLTTRAEEKFTIEQLAVNAVMALISTVFLGAGLGFLLYLLGVHSFLGIPIP